VVIKRAASNSQSFTCIIRPISAVCFSFKFALRRLRPIHIMPKRSIFHDGDFPKVNSKRARVELSTGQEREICRYKMEHSKKKLDISLYFSTASGVTIGRSTVSDILSKNMICLLPLVFLHTYQSHTSTYRHTTIT